MYLCTRNTAKTMSPIVNPTHTPRILLSMKLHRMIMLVLAIRQKDISITFITQDPIPRDLKVWVPMNWRESKKYCRVYRQMIEQMCLLTSYSSVKKLARGYLNTIARNWSVQMDAQLRIVDAWINSAIYLGLFCPMKFPILVMVQKEQPMQGAIIRVQTLERATWAAICSTILKLPRQRVMNSYMKRSRQKGMATQKHSKTKSLFQWNFSSTSKISLDILYVEYFLSMTSIEIRRMRKVRLVERRMPQNPQEVLMTMESRTCTRIQIPNTQRMGLKINCEFRLFLMKSLVQKQTRPGIKYMIVWQEQSEISSFWPVAIASLQDIIPTNRKNVSRTNRFMAP